MASSSYFSPISAPTFLISNIGSLISIKLENHNYLMWKSQFLPVLRGHWLVSSMAQTLLLSFLFDKEGNPTKEVNPAFTTWFQQDLNVLCWSNTTPSESILAHVVGLKSSPEVWLALERRFAFLAWSCSSTQISVTKHQERRSGQSITKYIQKLKHLSVVLHLFLVLLMMKIWYFTP